MRTISLLFISLIVWNWLAGWLCLEAQQNDNAPATGSNYQVDKRVWNQSYWRQMMRQGLVQSKQKIVKEKSKPGATRNIAGMVKPGGNISVFLGANIPVIQAGTERQSVTTVAVHPLDHNIILLASNSVTLDKTGQDTSAIAIFVSQDGGLNWANVANDLLLRNSSDAVAGMDAQGRFYIAYTRHGDASDDGYSQQLAYSDDNGTTWKQAGAAGDGKAILDKAHLWVDRADNSQFKGHIYRAWTCFNASDKGAQDGQIQVSRSTDRGLTWSEPLTVSQAVEAGSHNHGVGVASGPLGEVYTVWAIYDKFPGDETALGFAVSQDGGKTFAPARRILTNIRGIRHSRTGSNMRVHSFPAMAVDVSEGPQRGHIYVAWSNIGVPGSNQGQDIDIYLIRSPDSGKTWSLPQRINQDSQGQGKQHCLPVIACDADSGFLAVLFHDNRHVPASDCELFTAVSLDGKAWADFPLSNTSFTPHPVFGYAPDHFSDGPAIAVRDGRFYPCWTGNSSEEEKNTPSVGMIYVAPFIMTDNSPDANEHKDSGSQRSRCGATGIEAVLLLTMYGVLRRRTRKATHEMHHLRYRSGRPMPPM
jgi:hypothetical protein